MFKNIGKKIKALAQVICWIGIILSIIAAVSSLILGASTVNYVGAAIGGYTLVGSIIYSVIILIVGPLVSWLGSFFLYGFGELIDNSSKIVENTQPKAEEATKNKEI